MPTWILVVVGAAFLAWTNGANDVFKGVATLYGCGTASYRAALTWATITTAAGSLCAALVSNGLVRAFSAKGLVPDEVAAAPSFSSSVALGAATTVWLATRFGLPISTTHAIVGALVGAGWICAAGAVDFSRLGSQFLIPLAASPLVALALGALVYAAARSFRARFGIREDSCACVELPNHAVVSAGLPLPVSVTTCAADDASTAVRRGARFGIRADSALDLLHFLSSGATSFARGLNDAPKIAGLLVLVSAATVSSGWLLVGIALVMSIGGWVGARRVAQTVSLEITELNAGQGLAANLSTAVLVLTASRFGVPVSTTHTSCGAIIGVGVVTRRANTAVVGKIVLAWLFTLPIAALLAGFLAWIFGEAARA